MRYFKYKNAHKNYNIALKEQYKTLTSDEKRAIRKHKMWNKIAFIVSFTIFLSCMFIGIWAITLIPMPNWWLWEILVSVGILFLVIVLLIVSGAVTIGLSNLLWDKAESYRLPTMKKAIFSKACAHLRDYYGLQEPYLITKCFDATDEIFKNHDVCIFVTNDELRITVDLVRGFLHGERDLGCYAFKRNEIQLSKQPDGNRLTVALQADNVVFRLGYRAKSYIEKHFLTKGCK